MFRYRCGQALSHFLDVEGLFWIGYYGRARLHLCQADLAKELGVTRQTLSRYERGLSRIPERHSETIITVFQRIAARHEDR